MDRVDHRDHMIYRRFRQHAMAQIENMSGPAAGALEHVDDPAPDLFGRCKQSHWIEIAWTATSCPTVAQPSSRFTRQSKPITSPPAAPISLSNPAVPVLKLMTGTPGVIPAIAERVYGRTNCS